VPQSPKTPLETLLSGPMLPGKLVWIGLRPQRHLPPLTPASAVLIAEHGLEGDHYRTSRNGGRQVTLISSEDLGAIASFLGRDHISPGTLRRNFVTEGINLLALKGRRFWVGSALVESSGDCAPCSRMETALGPGGYNAVRGHGGITAKIIKGGSVHLGDVIRRAD